MERAGNEVSGARLQRDLHGRQGFSERSAETLVSSLSTTLAGSPGASGVESGAQARPEGAGRRDETAVSSRDWTGIGVVWLVSWLMDKPLPRTATVRRVWRRVAWSGDGSCYCSCVSLCRDPFPMCTPLTAAHGGTYESQATQAEASACRVPLVQTGKRRAR